MFLKNAFELRALIPTTNSFLLPKSSVGIKRQYQCEHKIIMKSRANTRAREDLGGKGLIIWLGSISMRIGGMIPEENG